MHKVFIDGQSGTTGLQIQDQLNSREDIELLTITDSDRKNPLAKQAIINEADVTILCLPDDAAIETASFAAKTDSRVLDASTAHRVHPDWVYGMPELFPEQRQKIVNARYVSNPGCYPTGFLLGITPLITSGYLSDSAQYAINAVSGYSGGGKNMIERYENQIETQPENPWWTRPYALRFGHKHVPEMKQYACLKDAPLFTPSVGHYRQGMLVSVPIAKHHMAKKCSAELLQKELSQYYQQEPFIRVHLANDESMLDQGFLNPQLNNLTNYNDIFVFGNDEQLQIISVLDNLGKGASGAAVQNLNLMLGAHEATSLI